MIKRLIIFFICFCSINCFSQKISNQLEISLLTCSSGNELYSTFGHSAIRVKNNLDNKDFVFDYGVFDFNEPFFIFKFLRGNLNYRLGVRNYDDFLSEYREEAREVYEEKMNLTYSEKLKIQHLLLENYRPENRYYRYDFLFDNCSSRIRDIIDNLNSYNSNIDENFSSATFREYLGNYLDKKPWIKFGIDLALGSSVDKIMTFKEQMFLPTNLSFNLRKYRRIDNNSYLLLSPTTIIQGKLIDNENPIFFTPLICFGFILLTIIALTILKPKNTITIRPIVYAIMGVAGLFILLLWIGTTHYSTKANWNLLWLNPLYFLFIFVKRKRLLTMLLIISLAADLGVIFLWNFIPQELNFAILPLIGLNLFLKGKMFIEIKKTGYNKL